MTRLSIKTDRDFFSRLLHISLPIAFQNLMLASVAAADALMLGRLNQNFMSAVSLATQIQFVQNMFIFSIVSVEAILGAQYFGKCDMKSLNKIFCISIQFSFFISVIFFAGCIFCPRFLMTIFTDEEELISIGISYLKIAGWSYLITGISQCYLAMMKVTNHQGKTATVSSCAVIINIILNAVFIFGLFGMKKMNAEGAALATLIARIAELVWVIIVSYKKGYIHPSVSIFFAKQRLLLKDFCKLLLPLMSAGLAWGCGFTSYTAFMGHLGCDAAAANSVVAVVRDLLCCFCNGLSNAAGIIIGYEFGKGNLEKGKLYGDKLLTLSLLLGLVITVILFLLTPLVSYCVKLTEQADIYLFQLMIVTSVYMFGRTVNTIVVNGIFDCGGDTLFDVYSLAVCMWCLAVPLAALGTFVFNWPVVIVYACTCVDEVGKIPWVLHHFKKYRWVKDLTR